LAKCLVDFIDYDLKANEPWIKINNDMNTNTKRPFCFISLGGSTNSSTLIGHNITYHGATSGDIVKCLKEAKYMNPIIYFDELDKISKTEHGNEISSVLTHITDPAQNEHFTDRYFSEVKIDLSRCIVVFSYNDASKIDRILYDRIQEIKLQAIPLLEKIEICKRFLIPEILENMGYNNNDLILKDKELENLILSYTYEAGVRKIKEKLNEILRNHHLNRLVKNETIVKEVNINNDYIDTVLNDHHKILLKKITNKPAIGCIHGMYATTNGLGDIMLVQVKKMYNKEILGLHTTGSLEKVITESIQVARTVAWNLLTDDERKDVETKFINTGLHIHCPDGSTPKDGPSAGTAITTAIYSLLTNKLIKNDLAITGEIDLDGNVTAIGGLDAKLSGAKRAGIKLALVPEENKRDVEILLNKNKTLVDNKFKVKFISHINEVLKIAFKNK
jgi:ATP-dependent Lon protease